MSDQGHLEIKRRRIAELEAEKERLLAFIRAQEKTIYTLRADLAEMRRRVS
jgi:hypothetical protein